MKNPNIVAIAKFISTMTYQDMMEFAASLPEISAYRTPAQRAESMSNWTKEYLSPEDPILMGSLLTVPLAPNTGVYLPVANAENGDT
jgi:hypothetical protein